MKTLEESRSNLRRFHALLMLSWLTWLVMMIVLGKSTSELSANQSIFVVTRIIGFLVILSNLLTLWGIWLVCASMGYQNKHAGIIVLFCAGVTLIIPFALPLIAPFVLYQSGKKMNESPNTNLEGDK